MKPYNYSMGLLAMLVAGTTAKSLTDSINRDMAATNQINYMSTLLASIVGLLMLAADPTADGFATGFLGTKGLLTAFLAAFVTVTIYKVCVKNNVTIRMPDEVPPNISQVFKDVIPFTLSVVFLYALDIFSAPFCRYRRGRSDRSVFCTTFFCSRWLCWYYFLYFGAYAFFWFVGIHGPSIV